jgi:hypothetical protein
MKQIEGKGKQSTTAEKCKTVKQKCTSERKEYISFIISLLLNCTWESYVEIALQQNNFTTAKNALLQKNKAQLQKNAQN